MLLNRVKDCASECTVRPNFKSPIKAIFKLSIDPISSLMVYRSSSVCVGCCPAPSPAFMTGTSTKSDMNFDTPSSSCLITSASLYASNILAVSAMLSPFETELESLLANPMHCPLKRFIAVSKDILVLVDGSKNIKPNTFPFNSSEIALD